MWVRAKSHFRNRCTEQKYKGYTFAPIFFKGWTEWSQTFATDTKDPFLPNFYLSQICVSEHFLFPEIIHPSSQVWYIKMLITVNDRNIAQACPRLTTIKGNKWKLEQESLWDTCMWAMVTTCRSMESKSRPSLSILCQKTREGRKIGMTRTNKTGVGMRL